MTNWEEMSRENLRAASTLVEKRLWRSAVSRSHYAAYCALTAELLQAKPAMTFPYGFGNPPHQKIPGYVMDFFGERGYGLRKRESIARRFVVLSQARIDADYKPVQTVGESEATRSIQAARMILRRTKIVP